MSTTGTRALVGRRGATIRLLKPDVPKGKGLSKRAKLQVKSLIEKQKETKTIEQSLQNSQEAWSATTRISHLSPIGQGDGEHQRDGLEVKGVRLKYRLHLQQQNTNQRVIRVTFFRWFPTDPPAAADLYTAGNIQRPITEGFYEQHLGQIISDKIYNIDQYNPQKQISGSFKLPYKISFSGILSGNLSKGQIYVAIGSDVTDTASQFDFASILFYKEM